MAEQNNWVARELLQLDIKEPDATSLNVRELRVGVSMGIYTCPLLDSHPGPIHVHGTIQNSKVKGVCLPPPINQCTPVSVSSILQQSTSDLDTDHGDIIDETIKQVAQSVNWTLL